MTILYVPKKCEGSSLQVRKKEESSKEKRRMKQIMVKKKKDENEMIVKYNRTRCCGDNNKDKEDRSKSPKLMILS